MDSNLATKRVPLTRSKTASSAQVIEIKQGDCQRPNSPQIGPKDSQPPTNIITNNSSQEEVLITHNQDQDKNKITVTSYNYDQCFKEAFTCLTQPSMIKKKYKY